MPMNKYQLLQNTFPAGSVKTRLIDRLSYAADAGFYRLVPEAVVFPEKEEHICSLFSFAQQNTLPVTFRAAGTSLSGQSVTNGILAELSRWNAVNVEREGDIVSVQPGVTGAQVNARLKRYKRKIGPDPASIQAAMMGGIVSNNSSGMCCGVTHNSYHTLQYLRFILPNGRIFDTAEPADYRRFELEADSICKELIAIRNEIVSSAVLMNLIRSKYQTKNTVGYSFNAFLDFEHPLDIFAHLLVGAEGTLAFLSRIDLRTIPDKPIKLTGLLYYKNMADACKSIIPLTASGAEAIELMDRASLASVEHLPGIPEYLRSLGPDAAALLVEYQANSVEEIRGCEQRFCQIEGELSLMSPAVFTRDSVEQAFLWKVRKGMFPSVGAVRKSGTTVILEDIAFPVSSLGDAIVDLQSLFYKHGYTSAIIFGHAKDGNIHFVITQSFNVQTEVARYDRFMRELVDLVIHKYQGTLKAEHGTGRNMAPFVVTEWGTEIYQLMKRLKDTVDPGRLLNPGVIINEDKEAHIKNLKSLPTVDVEVDKCMECGFCEPHCPSQHITMSPRRRIVTRRELSVMKSSGNTGEYKNVLRDFQYEGLDTCAVDGLCSIACPVGINTGDLVKRLRAEKHNGFAKYMASFLAEHFSIISYTLNWSVRFFNTIDRVSGRDTVRRISQAIRTIIPSSMLWNRYFIGSTGIKKSLRSTKHRGNTTAVVYFPSCISRNAGGHPGGKKNITDTFLEIAGKASYDVIISEEIQSYCCGQLFSSKGYTEAYVLSANRLIQHLWILSDSGRWPVVSDLSSCSQTLLNCYSVLNDENAGRYSRMQFLDSVDFLNDLVMPRLAHIHKKQGKIVLHPVCSLQKMGTSDKLISLARSCAEEVEVPLDSGCCGMAGDRGFWFPELTHSACRAEAKQVKEREFSGYYSSSRTCEVNLAQQTDRNYESILYMVNECIPERDSSMP